MPNNGLVFKCDVLEYKVSSTLNSASGSASTSSTFSKSHSAHGYTQWIPNSVNINTGIDLYVSSADDGFGNYTWEATYTGPGAVAGYTASGTTFETSVACSIRINNLKIYSKLTGSLWRVDWTSIDFYLNDTFYGTIASSAYDNTSNGVGPNYINILGMPFFMEANCSGVITPDVPIYDPCDPGAAAYGYEQSSSSTAVGGWRFGDYSNVAPYNLVWNTLEVLPWYEDPPIGACSTLEGLSAVDATNTYNLTINTTNSSSYNKTYLERRAFEQHVVGQCLVGDEFVTVFDGIVQAWCEDPCDPETYSNGYTDVYEVNTQSNAQGGTIRAIPNLERAIYRMNPDYTAMWRRFHFPEVRGATSRTCTIDNVTTSSIGIHTVFPDLGLDFLEIVNNATSFCEDAFPADIYTQSYQAATLSDDISYIYEGDNVCLCPPPSVGFATTLCAGSISWVCTNLNNQTDIPLDNGEAISLEFPSYVGTLYSYQGHAEPICRYLGSWVNPHWNLAYHYDNWEVEGVPYDWADYWALVKEQYIYNSSLDTPPYHPDWKKRTALVSSPWQEDDGHQPFLDAFFGGFRWIGISKWDNVDVQFGSPATYQYSLANQGSWGANGCSIGYSFSGITFSNFTSNNPTAELNYINWVDEPWLQLLRAEQVEITTSSIGVSSTQVYLAGIDGAKYTIGVNSTSTSNRKYEINPWLSTKYAGAWAIDNGVGQIADSGFDKLSRGASASVMSNSELVNGFQLGAGNQFNKFGVSLFPGLGCTSITISYPKFYLNPNGNYPYVARESGKVESIIFRQAPAIRFNQNLWYDPILGFLNPPFVSPVGVTNDVIDALCWTYRNTGVGGTNFANYVTSQLPTFYDSYEGQSIAVVSKFSNSFILPPTNYQKTVSKYLTLGLVNSFREVPPLACFPRTKRNSDTWAPETNSYAQVVYDYCTTDKNIISNQEANLFIGYGSSAQQNLLPAKIGMTTSGYYVDAVANNFQGWSVFKFSPAFEQTLTPGTETDYRNYIISGDTFGIGFGTTSTGIGTGTADFAQWGIASATPYHGYFGVYSPPLQNELSGARRHDLDIMLANQNGNFVDFSQLGMSTIDIWSALSYAPLNNAKNPFVSGFRDLSTLLSTNNIRNQGALFLFDGRGYSGQISISPKTGGKFINFSGALTDDSTLFIYFNEYNIGFNTSAIVGAKIKSYNISPEITDDFIKLSNTIISSRAFAVNYATDENGQNKMILAYCDDTKNNKKLVIATSRDGFQFENEDELTLDNTTFVHFLQWLTTEDGNMWLFWMDGSEIFYVKLENFQIVSGVNKLQVFNVYNIVSYFVELIPNTNGNYDLFLAFKRAIGGNVETTIVKNWITTYI